ncbi:murein L,D-transpeptidase catalytic domain family protein [Paraflavitalea sp. CAU 1676]|uniref:murein L,D-transpeptidase catalytic domain family protein n=1 Tax=Paraflavitalea sp. CAU 1676 TaxID=3032598 RepID=UPI0023DA0836|nr:murein L,D-transpeptidase catalytic domain family protein [Paraflavitalea sp. CAU 1676]MDF2190012.1 murein L,D-transpeptidase catalytic domain family protein [Paraflavitalea sp. CAU 1676]
MKKPNKARFCTLVSAPLLGLAMLLLCSFVPVSSTVTTSNFKFRNTTPHKLENPSKVAAFSFRNSMEIYDSLHLEELGLSKMVYRLAVKGMEKLSHAGKLKGNVISIVDFSQPSTNKRLYVIDLDNYELLYNTWVAHGMRSGKTMANVFSNKPSSNKSSLGFYITGEAYQGTNGYSLKLQGVEKGINDFAYRRAIVIHGADYVSEQFISNQGYIGRSKGCPAVPIEICQPMIDQIKDGTCLFIYHPTSTYRSRSPLLR